jgi:hypothetical protein
MITLLRLAIEKGVSSKRVIKCEGIIEGVVKFNSILIGDGYALNKI